MDFTPQPYNAEGLVVGTCCCFTSYSLPSCRDSCATITIYKTHHASHQIIPQYLRVGQVDTNTSLTCKTGIGTHFSTGISPLRATIPLSSSVHQREQ
jgi:hypothetical protein